MATSKPFDIVLFGATAFTGPLVARYLLSQPESALDAPNALKWALAGRSQKKLEQVREGLKQHAPSVAPGLIDAIPLIIADSSNEASLQAMTKQTRVVLSLVGPYKLYGELLVKTCAENGVHYCDLTGEIVWVDAMISKYQSAAQKSGAILVHCCGFESIPGDITTFLMADYIRKKYNSTASEIDMYFTKLKGEASGGTMATIFTAIENSTRDELMRSRNPFFLTDEPTRVAKEKAGLLARNASSLKILYDKALKKWNAIFIGASVNQAIVHRSNYLLNGLYGDQFVYRERSAMGGWFSQLVLTVGTVVLGISLYVKWTRAILKRFSPSPGEGPSEEVMKNGYFVSESAGYDAAGKFVVKGRTVGAGDPGYSLTSKLISECAFCLAKGEQGEIPLTGGFYTPASAFGHKIATRLNEKKHITFTFKDVPQE